jgi:branched-chain amino acid transport system ATP-binding protein
MLLSLHNLCAGYDGSDVLKYVNLEIERGSVTCIVGPNGAGKSTVVRTISGLLKPRLGEIMFADHSIGGMSPRHILAMGIVQVPQNHSLFPEISVRENVKLGAFIINDPSLVRRRLAEVEELFPVVKERARDKAGNLSGGQQRLVEFARSIMLDPALIMLDEPSMGLDPRSLKQVFETISLMQSTGRTILLVEQNVRTGLSIATHGVVMESGQVRLEGSNTEVLNNPDIGHLYLGGMMSRAQEP